MYDGCPTLHLFRGGKASVRIRTLRTYVTSLLATGHAIPRKKVAEVELELASLEKDALELEERITRLQPETERRSRLARLLRYRSAHP